MESKLIKDLTAQCEIRLTNTMIGLSFGVFYGDVCLWTTIYDCLDGCKVELKECDGEYSIVGQTPVLGYDDYFDYTCYGSWESEEEAEEWLKNPIDLY